MVSSSSIEDKDKKKNDKKNLYQLNRVYDLTSDEAMAAQVLTLNHHNQHCQDITYA